MLANLCPINPFRHIGVVQRAFLVPNFSQLPSAQNNPDAKVACLGGGMFWELQPPAWSPAPGAAQHLGRRVLCSLVPPLSRAATGSAG